MKSSSFKRSTVALMLIASALSVPALAQADATSARANATEQHAEGRVAYHVARDARIQAIDEAADVIPARINLARATAHLLAMRATGTTAEISAAITRRGQAVHALKNARYEAIHAAMRAGTLTNAAGHEHLQAAAAEVRADLSEVREGIADAGREAAAAANNAIDGTSSAALRVERRTDRLRARINRPMRAFTAGVAGVAAAVPAAITGAAIEGAHGTVTGFSRGGSNTFATFNRYGAERPRELPRTRNLLRRIGRGVGFAASRLVGKPVGAVAGAVTGAVVGGVNHAVSAYRAARSTQHQSMRETHSAFGHDRNR